MSENGNSASVDDLVREVVTTTPSAVRQPTEDRVETQLHHVDIPKLVDAGVVEYDPQKGKVRYRSDEMVETVLRAVE